jgi:hypothetical protein
MLTDEVEKLYVEILLTLFPLRRSTSLLGGHTMLTDKVEKIYVEILLTFFPLRRSTLYATRDRQQDPWQVVKSILFLTMD